jgi:hypothetical protein
MSAGSIDVSRDVTDQAQKPAGGKADDAIIIAAALQTGDRTVGDREGDLPGFRKIAA